MRCQDCGAPRVDGARLCPFCSSSLAGGGAAGDVTAARAWDADFVRLRRLPKANALLSERAGLASAPRPSVLRAAAPLVLFGAAAAAVLYNRGLEDQRGMLVGVGLAAIGIAAAFFETRRVARLGRLPIEAHLVRFGVRDTGVHEPGARQGEHASGGHGKVRWLIALEDGSVRHVWPQPDARGRTSIKPGAAGVAWLQGEYVLGFEPLT